MLAISDEEKAAWLSPSRQLAIRVSMLDTVYDNDSISSMSFDSGSISGETYQIGSTYMNTIKLVFPTIVESVKEDVELSVSLGVLIGAKYSYVKLGTFYITEFDRDRNSNQTTVTASDKMIYMEGSYNSKLKYPAQYRDVALEIANLAGVEVDVASFQSLGIGTIAEPEGYTHRQAIGLIAQFEGGFASFNREGKLEIRRLRPTDFTVSPENYLLKGFKKNENSYRIGGITAKIGNDEEDTLHVGSLNGSQVELENKVMTQILLNKIWDLVKSLNYFPFELKWQGCPALEAGDWFYVKDKNGTRYSVPNLSYSFNFAGGLVAESKAITNSASQATYRYKGPLHQKIDNIDALLSANNWNSNYYDQTEPTNPKEGDIWFKPNGQDTELWVYKKIDGKLQWDFEVSTAPNEELQEQIDNIQKDVEDAKNEAEQATDSANKAVSDATHAVSVADQSKAAADEAKADAANAITNANQAKENASDALASAQTALDDLKNLDTVNLLPNSTWNSGQGTWTVGFNGRYEILPAEEDKPNSQILHGLPLTATTQQLSNMPHPLYVESGQNYSIAFDFKEKNYTNSRAILYLRIFPEKTTSNNSANALWSQGLTHATFGIVANVDEFKRLSYSFKVPVSGWLDVIPYDNDATGLHETFYREIMLVRSTTVPNSWSPYPGDTKIQIDNINGELSQKVSQTTFDVLNQTVANQATEISQNSEAIKLKANQTTVDELNGRVSTAESSITAIAGQIELKANQSDVDTINGKVTMVESTLTTQAGQITALNTKTDGMNTQIGSLQSSYDGLSSTVANIKGDTANLWIPSDLIEKGNNGYLSTTGVATPTIVNLYTDFFDVSKFSSMTFQVIAVATSATIRVCFYLDETETSFISRKDFDATVINNYIAEIPINAKFARFSSVNPNERGGKLLATLGASASIEEFSSLVQRIDVIQTTVNNKAEQSQVTQLADQITSVVSTLHENLVRNGDFSSGLDGYSLLGNPTTLVGTLSDIDRSSGIPKEAKNYLRISFPVSGTTEYVRYVFDNPNDYLGKKVTFSFYAKKNSSFAVDGCQVYGRATVDGNSVYSDYVRTLTNGWVHYSITLDLSSFQSGTNSITDIRLFIAVNNKATAGYVYLTALQAEVGSQVSEWGLEYLRGFGESQITQLTNLINLRVKEGDVINQINISPESILIAGNKVQITGQTYIENSVIGTAQIKDAAITDAKIGNLSANKITTGSLNAANVNIINMNASNIVTGELTGITLRSSANGSSFYVRGNELFMQKANGDHLTMDTSGIYWYNSAGDILFQSSKKLTTSDIFGTAKYNAYLAAYNETRSVTYASALKGEGGVNDYTYVAHRASKIYANRMEINTGSGTPSHLYLGTSSAEADVRIVVAGDGDISYARLRARELFGNVVSVNGATDGVQLYLQTKDEVRVKNYGSDASATSYKAVRASAFNTSSLAEYKTNIETFEKSALDIIGQSTIYSYNLKGDIETDEIGLVIGEGYSIAQEVVNGDGVSQYRMNSLSWKAIQELHEKIKDLENELAVFKSA
ncbi:hypothetical protein [Enterococcus sp. DIV0179]|uniref:hypothetical protein n=1 Tax=Enterococcus sp. DIV0179 TaxID=2774767 RepID=UPI003D2FB50A